MLMKQCSYFYVLWVFMLLASKCRYHERTELDCVVYLVVFIVQYDRFLLDSLLFLFANNGNDLQYILQNSENILQSVIK
jgi:hypothetical protein